MSPAFDPEHPGQWRYHLPIEGVLEHEQVWGAGNQGSTVDILSLRRLLEPPVEMCSRQSKGRRQMGHKFAGRRPRDDT